MKKEELNKILKEEFDNITVSNDLKKKTLNKINQKSNNVIYFPYLKNICAIFIVSIICFSVYTSKINFTPKEESEKISNGRSIEENRSNVNETFLETDVKTQEMKMKVKMMPVLENEEKDFIYNELYLEEDFLIKYPDAKKTEEGYFIESDGKKQLYIFENGILKTCKEVE